MSIALWNDEQERPLQHLRVVDLSIMVPGPFLTRVLAQYGADVIKVEQLPHGDSLRETPNTHLFELLNQGKKSIAVDLKTADGAKLVRQLAAEADVLVENFREGVLDALQLGYPEISEENPDLLYFSMRGFEGKNASRSGHDLNFVATSGVGEWFLEQPNYSTQYGDLIAGTFLPLSKLMIHLANPARTGMHLISHADQNFRSLFLPRAYDSLRSEEKDDAHFGIQEQLNGKKPHSRFYKCRDGIFVSLNAIQEKHWQRFCEVVDKPQWKSRSQDSALTAEVENLFLDAPSTYWEALTHNQDFCLFRVVPWSEHLSFSQGRAQLSKDPLTWAGFAAFPELEAAPCLGRDTFSVLHSMGVSNKSIATWIESKVILQPETQGRKISSKVGGT